MSLNLCLHIGNLTADPETKITTTGKPQCRFSLAVTRNYSNQQGGRDADFITFTAYGPQAETAQKYLTKGRKVRVTSTVKTGSYEKDGRRIWTTEFIVRELEFLSPKKDAATEQGQTPPLAPQPGSPDFPEVDDDDLPF